MVDDCSVESCRLSQLTRVWKLQTVAAGAGGWRPGHFAVSISYAAIYWHGAWRFASPLLALQSQPFADPQQHVLLRRGKFSILYNCPPMLHLHGCHVTSFVHSVVFTECASMRYARYRAWYGYARRSVSYFYLFVRSILFPVSVDVPLHQQSAPVHSVCFPVIIFVFSFSYL